MKEQKERKEFWWPVECTKLVKTTKKFKWYDPRTWFRRVRYYEVSWTEVYYVKLPSDEKTRAKEYWEMGYQSAKQFMDERIDQ